jgi:hypothetical protein
MKSKLLIAAILISGLLATACSVEKTPEKAVLDLGFIGAAMETVVQYNHSSVKGTIPYDEIPKEFWAPEIEALNALKVYWHNNNLAIVLPGSGDEAHGIYVYVPISSYMPMGDIIELTFGQESYTFRVEQPDLANASLN